MGAVYALLGLVFGVAIAEALHWRVGNAGKGPGIQPGLGPRRSPAAQSTQTSQTPHSSARFRAQDYYDR
jgi:hypothetical protein